MISTDFSEQGAQEVPCGAGDCPESAQARWGAQCRGWGGEAASHCDPFGRGLVFWVHGCAMLRCQHTGLPVEGPQQCGWNQQGQEEEHRGEMHCRWRRDHPAHCHFPHNHPATASLSLLAEGLGQGMEQPSGASHLQQVVRRAGLDLDEALQPKLCAVPDQGFLASYVSVPPLDVWALPACHYSVVDWFLCCGQPWLPQAHEVGQAGAGEQGKHHGV